MSACGRQRSERVVMSPSRRLGLADDFLFLSGRIRCPDVNNPGGWTRT